MATVEDPPIKDEGGNESASELRDQLDKIEPRSASIERTIGKAGSENSKTYVQRPLGHFGKLELFAILGEAVDRAMTSDTALNPMELFGRGSQVDGDSTDAFLLGVAKLARFAPDVIKDLYCLSLGIPRDEREWAKFVMEQPPEDGGLDDEDGFGILETFFDQNAEAIRDLFRPGGPLRSLGEKVQETFGLNVDSSLPRPSSKPTKRTRPRTPRR